MFPILVTSQIQDPTSWSFDVEDLGGGSYNLLANVEIDEGWHVYSQYKNAESFIVSTSFYFKNIDGLKFIDSEPEKIDYVDGFKVFFTESQPIEKFVPIQEEIARYFEGKASFSQKVEVQEGITQIKAMYEFMVCNDQECLPPEIVDVIFSLKKKELTESEEVKNLTKEDYDCSNDYKRNIKGLESIIQSDNFSFFNLLEALLAGIIAGLIALLTPCVFPMIPLTVSFFLKGSEDKRKAILRASLYGGFIVLIYFLLSLPFHFFSLDAEVLNQISTNVWLNLIFFLVFTVFAISFFGYFEIRLPSKLLNKVDSASDIGGTIGIFFMALTLALVSFSCTGPVLGAALAKTGLSSSSSIYNFPVPNVSSFFVAFPFIISTFYFFGFMQIKKSGYVFKLFRGEVKGIWKKTIIRATISLPIFYFLIAGAFSPAPLSNLLRETFGWVLIFSVFLSIIILLLYSFGFISFSLKRTQKANNSNVFYKILTIAIVLFLFYQNPQSINVNGVSIQLSASMVGFGLALGIPFALFAVFPNWLKSLPKSGGWMNTLKVFIGFLEVALAIKFLSNADAVYKLGIIKYETFFVLWALTFFGLALYLFGVIKFPHDTKGKKIGGSRIVFGVLTLGFVLYLIPGATCKYQDVFTHTLFGLPPPKTYSYCNEDPSEALSKNNDRIVTKDYFEAIELSKKYNKPILVDFTGMACVNCRKLENQIWNDLEIDKLIGKYILAQLYVDVRKEVPEHTIDECFPDSTWKKSKVINTTGKQWSTLQTLTFEKNTQPLHIILKPSNDSEFQEELLKDENGSYFQPKAYKDANNIDTYKDWLEQGLKDFYSE